MKKIKNNKEKTLSKSPKKSKAKIILDSVGYIFLAIVFTMICVVVGQTATGQHPNLFGYCIYYIETGSMSGNKPDSFDAHSIIISKLVDEKDCYDLKVGDIITFTPTDPNLPSYVDTKTHRIVDINYENETIITRGDAVHTNDTQIEFSDVEAKFIHKSPFLTGFFSLIKSFWGFLLLIFIPLLALIIFQVYSFFLESKKAKLEKENEKLEKEQDKLLEERKKELERQAIEEYLNKQNNKED